LNVLEHDHSGGNHQHIGHATTMCRDAPLGKKVGLIVALRTGHLCGQATSTTGKINKTS